MVQALLQQLLLQARLQHRSFQLCRLLPPHPVHLPAHVSRPHLYTTCRSDVPLLLDFRRVGSLATPSPLQFPSCLPLLPQTLPHLPADPLHKPSHGPSRPLSPLSAITPPHHPPYSSPVQPLIALPRYLLAVPSPSSPTQITSPFPLDPPRLHDPHPPPIPPHSSPHKLL